MRNFARTLTAVALLPLVVISLTSCSQNDESENNNDDDSGVVISSDATASRVILAAVILASGDIDKALLEGLVTAADVEAATQAIEDGTLDQWRERAESGE